MKASVVTITPTKAAKLLEGHVNFRKFIARNSRKIERALETKRFYENGESIKIDIHGQILDGHHRLAACAKTGVSFKTVVVTDLDPAVVVSIDTGAPRRASDFLAHAGEANARALAGCLRLEWVYNTSGDPYGKSTPAWPTTDDLFRHLKAHPEARWAADLAEWTKRRFKPVAVAPMAALFVRAYNAGWSEEDIESFVAEVVEDDPEPGAARAYRSFFERQADGTKVKAEAFIGVTTKALNAHLAEKTIHALTWSKRDKPPFIKTKGR